MSGFEFGTDHYGISHIKNKELFTRSSGIYRDQFVYDTDTANKKHTISLSGIGSYMFNIFLGQDSQNRKLYYYKIDFDALPSGYYSFNNLSAFGDALKQQLLLEGFDEGSRWTITTINSQDRYELHWKEENGEKIPIVVKSGEYVAEEPQVVTLKPINR